MGIPQIALKKTKNTGKSKPIKFFRYLRSLKPDQDLGADLRSHLETGGLEHCALQSPFSLFLTRQRSTIYPLSKLFTLLIEIHCDFVCSAAET